MIPLHSIKNGICTCRNGADCESPGKHPRVSWTQYQETRPTELQIRRWWRKWPDANIGIITGAVSGIIALDVDGHKGRSTLKEGKYHIPPTAVSSTGGGGWHYVYKHPGGNCRNFAGKTGETILPNVDFRGDGGLIVVAPSIHKSGRNYEWLMTPKDEPPADPPGWLVKLIRDQAQGGEGGQGTRLDSEDWSVEVTKGQRNVELTRRAGSLLANGKMRPEDALPMLMAWNETHCNPPLDEAEVKQIVESIASKERSKPSVDDAVDPAIAAEQLATARETVTGLLTQAASDTAEAIKMALTDREVIDALTLVSDQERGTFEAACMELREKGATARDVAALRKTVNAEKRKRRHLRAVSSDDVSSRGSTEIFFEGAEFIPARLEAVLLDEFRFAYTADTLYVYQDGVYMPYGVDVVARRAKELLGEEFRENRVKETVYHISVSCGRRPEELNRDANRYITVLNGRYDWIEGKLLPHDPEALTTLQIPVTYDPNATCPVIDKFFRDVLPADAVPLVEEMFGYAMIPDTRFEKAFMLTGSGSNGKSTLLKLMETFIGSSNISKIPLQELDENRFKRADLFGKLVNLFADLDARALRSSSYFKTVVSGDSIDAERKNRDPFYFRPFARLIFSANEIPRSRDKSFAYYRRWAILPFPNQFTGEDADKALGSKLVKPEEISGLFLRAVDGLRRLFANEEFTMPESVREALHRYQIANDSARAFLEECCEEAGRHFPGVFKQSIYNAYIDFCKANNFQPVSQRKFNVRLLEVYPFVVEDRNNPAGRMWRGIALL